MSVSRSVDALAARQVELRSNPEVEIMAMDSQKHERILRFIERRLEAAG